MLHMCKWVYQPCLRERSMNRTVLGHGSDAAREKLKRGLWLEHALLLLLGL